STRPCGMPTWQVRARTTTSSPRSATNSRTSLYVLSPARSEHVQRRPRRGLRRTRGQGTGPHLGRRPVRVPRRLHRTRGRTPAADHPQIRRRDRKSTRLNSSHVSISYAVFCLKKKKKKIQLSGYGG